MGVILIGGLLLLVVHAACKENALKQAAAAAQASDLPAPSPVTSGAATSIPSPATALGAPGAFGGYTTMVDTNSQFPVNGAGQYTITDVAPGTNGIPLPIVPGTVWNGNNPNPASDKTLSTQTRPRRYSPMTQYPDAPLFKL